MATSKKPRKAYRAKPVGIPLNGSQKLRLELASRTHIDALYRGELTDFGWHTVMAHFFLLEHALGRPITQAVDALQSMAARAKRTGKLGATGDERKAIIEAYNEYTPQMMRLHDATINQAAEKVRQFVISSNDPIFRMGE